MSNTRETRRTAFVVGGTGVVGSEILSRLIADGWAVRALARSHRSEATLAEMGAEVVPGDLLGDGPDWQERVAGVDLVVHTALPRISPPIRRRRVARLTRRAAEGIGALLGAAEAATPIVAVSTTLIEGDLALARPARAVEVALQDHPNSTIVRLPWVYGASGPVAWVSQGLAARRYRVVGPGTNHWPLISAADAADAVLLAATIGPGTFTASEADAPSQRELIEHLCSLGGSPIPDHVPQTLAGYSLGSALAAALGANGEPKTSEALVVAGWHPRHDWRSDLLEVTRNQEAPEEE